MANRFPLIGNSVTKRLEELAVGDNLNLSQSGIYDGAGVGNEGQILYSTGDGVEWANVPAEIDTTYSISAEDGTGGKKIIRLTDVNLVTDDVVLVPGTNISLSRSNDEITIDATYIDNDTITSIKGGTAGSFVTGDVTLSPSGSVFITQVGNTITISASDTNTITRLKGGSSGSFVTGDVTITASGASTASQAGNTINIASTDTVTRIKGGTSGSFVTGDVTFSGGSATTVSQTGQTVTISSPNTTYGLNVSSTSSTVKTITLAGSDNSEVDVTLTAGAGVVLTVDNNDIEFSVDVTTIHVADLGDTTITTPEVNGQVLKYNSGVWINQAVDYSEISNLPDFKTVATSGSYNDLLDLPDLQPVATSGSYTDLTSLPDLKTVATSGSYNDLLDLPDLVTDASDLTDSTGRFFSGDYGDLTNLPALTQLAVSADYNDITVNKPTIPPDREYVVSAETNIAGAAIRLREINALVDDSLIIASGTGINVSRIDENTINISSSISGLPSGLTATASSLVFEGSSVDSFKTTLQVVNPTANRTLTLPNATGTIVIDSTNKTYTSDVTETDTKFYESKLGLLGSNTGGTSYSSIAGTKGLIVSSDAAVGGQQSASQGRGMTITPPPSVHIGTTAPSWAKDGDLWYNNQIGVLRIFDESLYPTPDATVDYFQAVDQGESRFFCDRAPLIYIPTESQYVVGPGIPTGAFVSSRFDPQTGNNVGWFNLNTTVTTNIPHNATLRVYNTNPNVNLNNIWRTLYEQSKTLQSRTSSAVTTNALAPNIGENVSFNGFKSYSVLRIQTNKEAWVTLYTSDTARTNDASRPEGTSAPDNAGIICDFITGGAETILITPVKIGFTENETNNIPARIVNKTSINQTVTVTLTLLQLEA
jgi:hypothetical protein